MRNRPRTPQVIFNGDGFSEAWHEPKPRCAAFKPAHDTRRAALPAYTDTSTVDAFKKYGILTKRELESRYQVFTEQYAVNINIESETASGIARTMLLPASRACQRAQANGPGGVDRRGRSL